MAKLLKFVMDSSTMYKTTYTFQCPGCEMGHTFDPSMWAWNEDIDKPTLFNPYLILGERFKEEREKESYVCHSVITDGSIHFLSDTTHELKDLTVELPDYPNQAPDPATIDPSTFGPDPSTLDPSTL
jgi:hypothetical protein